MPPRTAPVAGWGTPGVVDSWLDCMSGLLNGAVAVVRPRYDLSRPSGLTSSRNHPRQPRFQTQSQRSSLSYRPVELESWDLASLGESGGRLGPPEASLPVGYSRIARFEHPAGPRQCPIGLMLVSGAAAYGTGGRLGHPGPSRWLVGRHVGSIERGRGYGAATPRFEPPKRPYAVKTASTLSPDFRPNPNALALATGR